MTALITTQRSNNNSSIDKNTNNANSSHSSYAKRLLVLSRESGNVIHIYPYSLIPYKARVRTPGASDAAGAEPGAALRWGSVVTSGF